MRYMPVTYSPCGGRLERAGLGGILRSCLHVGYVEKSSENEDDEDEHFCGTAFWVHWHGGRYLVSARHCVSPKGMVLMSFDEGRNVCGNTDQHLLKDVGVLPLGSVELPQEVSWDLCDGIFVFRDGNEGFDKNEVGELEYVKYGIGEGLYVGCEVYMMGYIFGENVFVGDVDGAKRSLPVVVRGTLAGWMNDGSQFLIDKETVCGFSGGPVCYFDGENWRIFGVVSGMVVEGETKQGFTVAMNLEKAFDIFDRGCERLK